MLLLNSSIGQFVHPVGGEGWGKRGRLGVCYFASCEYPFIRVHENLVQYPSNNISISTFYHLHL